MDFSEDRSIRALINTHPNLERSSDEFHLIRVHARHKYGTVYFARDTFTGDVVLLKQLDPSAIKPRTLMMFAREVNALAVCESPFFARIVGYTIDQKVSLAVQILSEDTLANYILGNKKPDPTYLTTIVLALASGMRLLHQNGIIHRDLKPSTIWLDDEMMPRITDLWNSRPLSDTKLMTRRIGTLSVMAPELATDHVYDEKVDVYSFGLLLYFICERKMPFHGMTNQAIVTGVTESGLRPDFGERTPPEIQSLIRACWDQEPWKRPSFSQICTVITNGKVMFPGTDRKMLFQKTMHFRQGENSAIRRRSDVSLRSGSLISDDYEDEYIERGNKTRRQTSEVSFTGLRDAESDQFPTMLDVSAKTLSPIRFDDFYDAVLPHLMSNNMKLVTQVLKAIYEMVERDSEFVEAICRSGFYELPILRSQLLCDPVLKFFSKLCVEKPSLIAPYMRPLVKSLVETKPTEMVHLLYGYVKQYKSLKKPLAIMDVFLDSWEVYQLREYGVYYVRVLYYLCVNEPAFKEIRLGTVRTILCQFLKSSRELTLIETYKAITQLYDCEFFIPYDNVVSHLRNENLRRFVLSMLLRIRRYPVQRKIVEAVLYTAKSSPKSSLILFRMAEQQVELASYFVKQTSWMRTCIYSTLDTYRLLLIVLKWPQLRGPLSVCGDLVGLLLTFLNQRSEFFVSSLCTIVRLIVKTQNSFNLFESRKFVETYVIIAQQLDTPRALHATMIVIDTFARIGFSESYLPFLARLIQIIREQSDTSMYAVQLLVILSQYKECHAQLESLGITAYFRTMAKMKEFQDLATKYLTNIGEAPPGLAEEQKE